MLARYIPKRMKRRLPSIKNNKQPPHMYRYILFVLFLFTTCSCASHRQSPEERLLGKITDHTSQQFSKKGLYFSQQVYGISQPIQTLHMQLCTDQYEYKNVSQARRLFVSTAKEYVNQINAYENVQSLFNTFPFELTNLQLNLFFIEKDHQHLMRFPYISRVYNVLGCIKYEKCDSVTGKPYIIHEESYETALERIETDSIIQQ